MMKYRSNSILMYLGDVATKSKLIGRCKAFASSKKLREKIDLFEEIGLAEYAIDNDMIEYQMKVDDQKLSQNTTKYAIGI
jgi:hypothetical protein